MLTDSHCHLDKIDLTPFDNNFSNMVDAAKEADVSQFLCVCIDTEHFQDVLKPAQQYSNIYCSVGVHPTHQDSYAPTVEELVELAQHEEVIAIGETGLDYFRCEDDDMTWQHDLFRTHIRAAIITQKPLIIHTRSAKEDTIRILAEENAQKVGGVMHCFAEDWETAQKAMELNFYISFSGIVSFNSAKELQEVAKKVPEDRFLIETDSPWLAPVPKRGKPNQPAYVKYVAEKMADLRGCSYSHIAKVSTDNFNRLFKL
ncbi:TatD family hydrolase [Cocleimonas sp. KMM 6892]|uniref:TatD family hydrolase n=1 Tax=unclassified Cocleimonas TaxID=2639732 RepID=UPI002DB6DC32|nr:MULTISPECIES: TatD family hydrolase [unclassified Cocleimonas]MEB8432279.1 TatD family hydrolase [Cocleimonas sp. KMM 6892]MEC4714635.1 TatD family hydrolase [Cocleimonas sp. KMM 6895]MEC4744551.1 TatD family hydrolase [Cocleimonas sp. KMM 6896]